MSNGISQSIRTSSSVLMRMVLFITLLNFEGHLAVVLYYSRVLLSFAISKEGY